MAQQTRVGSVSPYYRRWMERFPTAESLASAELHEALALWEGLGYYRRCRLLWSGARQVTSGKLPSSRDEWLKVPGVGRYTAGAIASIAFGEPVSVVDGNVERVYARLTADESVGNALKARAWTWAERMVSAESPGEWNEALMELGATICTPKNPRCGPCPVSRVCTAYRQGKASKIPPVKGRREVVEKHLRLVLSLQNGLVAMRLARPGEWWTGMWVFPYGEVGDGWSSPSLGTIRHSVTHHRLTFHIVLDAWEEEDTLWVEASEVAARPMPVPMRKASRWLETLQAERGH